MHASIEASVDASIEALGTFDPAAIAARCEPIHRAEDMRDMWRHMTWLAFDRGFETVRAPLQPQGAHEATIINAFSALAQLWRGHSGGVISPWIVIETFLEIKGFFEEQAAAADGPEEGDTKRADFLEWLDREAALCIDAIPSPLFLFPRNRLDGGSPTSILMTAIQGEAGPLTIEALLQRGARFSDAEETRLDAAFGSLEDQDLA